MNSIEWTNEQDDLLKNYNDYGIKYLCKMLNKTEYDVIKRLIFLNIKIFKQARKITKQKLKEILPNCYSISDVCRSLKVLTKGNTYELIKARIIEYELDTSHFLIKIQNKNNNEINENILSDGKKYRIQHKRLKNALLKLGVVYKCSECGINEWENKKITLDIDHINGNWGDCRKENLRFICPNCHRQTNTYGGRGIKNLRSKEISKQIKNDKNVLRRRNIEYDGLTDTEINILAKNYRNIRYKKIKDSPVKKDKKILKSRRVVERPSYKQLLEEIKIIGYSATGRKYGVSDNSIRKWIKFYEKYGDIG